MSDFENAPRIETLRLDEVHANGLELAWLAGFIDADGSIGMAKNKNTRSGLYIYSPVIQVSNTNEATMLRVLSLLKRLGILANREGLYLRRMSERNEAWADEFKIHVTRQEEVRVLLEAILPYLYTKRAQGEILLTFVLRRILIGKGRQNTYDGSEQDSYERIQFLNKKGKAAKWTTNPSLESSV